MAPLSDVPVPGEYTIDELATVARLPSRTIRFYQSRGALMPPEIRGRVAYYSAAHVERLKLIAQLQDRGLRVDAIADLVGSIERGEVDLAEWLGVEQQMQTSWVNDQPRTITELELLNLAGTTRPGLLADLSRVGLIERRGEVYLLDSPALLAIAMKLENIGIDLTTAKQAGEIVEKHTRRAVRELISLFLDRVRKGSVELSEPAAILQTLRPLGLEAVRVIFGRSMEHGLRKVLESGVLASLPKRTRRTRRT